MQHSTLKQTLSDSLWAQDLDRQNRYIAAQEAARTFALKVHAVSTRYTFTPARDLFLYTAQGDCVQAAMTLTEGGDSLTVIARIEDGETCWVLTDVSALRFDPAVYIAAVKARIDSNAKANGKEVRQ